MDRGRDVFFGSQAAPVPARPQPPASPSLPIVPFPAKDLSKGALLPASTQNASAPRPALVQPTAPPMDLLLRGERAAASPEPKAQDDAPIPVDLLPPALGQRAMASPTPSTSGADVPLEAIDAPPVAPAPVPATEPPPSPPAETRPALRAMPASSRPEEGPSKALVPRPPLRLPERIRVGGVLMDVPVRTHTTLPPNVEPSPLPQPLPELTPDEKRRLLEQLNEERRRKLEAEIDELYTQVVEKLGANQKISDQAMGLLRDARLIIMGRPEDFVEAEYRVQQVKALLLRRAESERWGPFYGSRIMAYEFLFIILLLLGFVGGLLTTSSLAEWLTKVMEAPVDPRLVAVAFPFWSTFMWGGIGGAVGALYSLWWHVADRQDFDRQYVMWYVVQPIMGMVLGGIIYLAIAAGFLVLQAVPPSDPTSVGSWLMPSLLACIAGFRQNFVYEVLNRIMAAVMPKKDETSGASAG
ncbi:MAG: hypothetical protein IT330_14725 [Anaerolineae bacterium]|nr:hypothetical protein [Anaerolineae bacterium]